MQQAWINALMGGAIIGFAVSAMLLLNGRVTGISGILNGVLTPKKGDTGWRVSFLIGLIFGGLVVGTLNPNVFVVELSTSVVTTAFAGLLVGFGTVMGGGCTSGHGVCGLSRLSVRSIVATMTFIAAGVAAVFVFRKLGVLP